MASAYKECRPSGSVHWVILATIFLVAIFLRLISIGSQGLWTDEALTIVLSNWSISDMLLLPTDPTPFLYYGIHKLLLSANSSVAAVRSISVVAGVMSVGVMYLLGRLAFGAAGGLLTAALLAVWSSHVDYSQDARAYSLLFLLTLLTSLGLLYYAHLLHREATESHEAPSGRRLALVIFGLGNVLSFYTHVTSVFWIVLTCFLLLGIVVRERQIHRTELLTIFGVMTIVAMPGIYRLVLQMLVGDSFDWLRQPGLIRFATANAEVFLPIGLWDNSLTKTLGISRICLGVVLAGAVALVGWAFLFDDRRVLRRLQERPAVLWVILAYLTVPVVVWLFGFVARPLFLPRVILFCVPGLILLIVGFCFAFERRVAARAGAAAVLLYGGSTLLFGTMRVKEDWRGAYEYLLATVPPMDVIAVCPNWNYPALRYHAVIPVASAVLAIQRGGRMVQIEDGLGTDRDWDKTYFHYFSERSLLVVLASRIAGRRAPEHNTLVAAKLELMPGQSVWRVDGFCRPSYAAGMDAAFAAIDPNPSLVWTEKRRVPSSRITIRRYRVSAPAALDIRRLAPSEEISCRPVAQTLSRRYMRQFNAPAVMGKRHQGARLQAWGTRPATEVKVNTSTFWSGSLMTVR
jgi:mannosyltransferase